MTKILRLESVACLVTALAAYGIFVADWKQFAIYFLLPDLSLLFFIGSPRIGCIAYNLAHNVVFPSLLLLFALVSPSNGLMLSSALIWLAHVHLDRSLGYGLKSANSFHETHLGQIGKSTRN